MRILKLFKKHVLALFAAIALIVISCNADLALPTYMSDIVDVGVQQGGIASPVPDTIRAESLDDLELFMSDKDAKDVEAVFSKADNNGIRTYKGTEEERADEKPLSETIKGELAKIETAFSNIWAAIESGIAPPGGKERIDALKQRQAFLKDELRTAEALEAARLDYDRALFWLEGMAAAEVDDAQLLRTFVARVVLGGPDDDDGLRVAFTFDDSAGLGDNPSLPGAIGPGGEVFDRMNASSTNCSVGEHMQVFVVRRAFILLVE